MAGPPPRDLPDWLWLVLLVALLLVAGGLVWRALTWWPSQRWAGV